MTHRLEYLFSDPEKDEKKNEAAKVPSFLHISATLPAMAVFPVPAGPLSHMILLGALPPPPCLIQPTISS